MDGPMKRAAMAQRYAVWLACSGLVLAAYGAPLGYVQVKVGDSPLPPTLLVAELPKELDLPESVHLAVGPDQPLVAAQVIRAVDGSRQLAFVLSAPLPARSQTTFEVQPGAVETPGLSLTETAEAITVRRGPVEVLCYRNTSVPPPAGVAPIYARNAYIHPLRTPGGQVVTDDFAPDHPHQKGVFCAWTKAKAGPRTVDFWNLPKGEGTVRYGETVVTTIGPVFAEFAVRQEHLDLKAPETERVALTETLTVRVWATGNAHVLDLESVQTAPAGRPLVLPTYLYGGMAFRGARGWRGKMEYLTEQGPSREAPLKGQPPLRAAWCGISGPVGEGWAGMLALADPANFRYPEPVRLHPTDPYFCFAPSQLGEWRFEPEQPRRFRYRLVVHDDRLTVAAGTAWQQTYIHPPDVVFRIERPHP